MVTIGQCGEEREKYVDRQASVALTFSEFQVVAHGNYIEEHAIVARSKPKREKRVETTAEFVQRVSRKGGKPNGLKLRFVWMKRRHH